MATHHTFTTTYFDNMWDNMRVQFFFWLGVGVEGGGGGVIKFLQKSNLHIDSCLGRAGRRPHVRPHVSHARFCEYIIRSRPMGTGSPPEFFFKMPHSTAFSPPLLSNTITPCVQLEYLREIRSHFIKKSV